MIVKTKYTSVDEVNHSMVVCFYTDIIKNAYEAGIPAKVAKEMASDSSLSPTVAEVLVRARWPMGYSLNVQLYDTPLTEDAIAQYVATITPISYLQKLEQIATAPMSLKVVKDILGVERTVVLPATMTTTIPIGKIA